MQKNKRESINAFDLVELLIAIILTWIGEKLLDSLWKSITGAIHRRSADKNIRRTNRILLFKLGNRLLLWVAHVLRVDEKLTRLTIEQANNVKQGFGLTEAQENLLRWFENMRREIH
jgi:hypothetical protein